jgi:anti-sigma factor RsiW
MSMTEISCVEVWREISNYIDAAIDPELRARMEAHLKVCAHCTAVLDGTRNVVKLLADGVEYDLPPDFSQRLYNKLKD